jgi:hypothetical protein
MKKIHGISVLVLIWLLSLSFVIAQEKEEKSKTIQKELKVTIDDESGEPTYTVETTTTENGEKKVVKKTYSSLDEMKEDSSIDIMKKSDENGNITLKLGDKGSNVMVFTSDDGETVDITIDDMSEDIEWVQAGEEEGHKVFTSKEGNVMIFKGKEGESGNSFSFITDDGDTNQITKSYKVKVIKDGEHQGDQIHEHENVFVIKDEDGNISMSHGGDDDVMVWVDESGHKTIKKSYHIKTEKASFSEASIQPIASTEEEFKAFNLSVMPELVLKSINYYPNPNQGEFTLAFTGSKKPVIVRILDLKGNMKMEENIEDFNGTFNQVLNVKHFDKGTYLLQIFQQDKVLNRKLVLE